MIDCNNLYRFENELLTKGYKYIAGTDEAGRGCMAGPCVISAVILNPLDKIDGLFDSKQLTAKKRETLYKEIINRALAYNIVMISNKEIDEINIYQAAKKGMYLALEGLDIKADYVLSDAMKLEGLTCPYQDIIHGDALSASIAAASILAKVTRDRYMNEMDIKYPQYGFSKHKGYCTKAHNEALSKYGPCDIHRLTYEPVKKVIEKKNTLFDNILD